MRFEDKKFSRFLIPLLVSILLQYPLIRFLVYQSPDSRASLIKTERFSGKMLRLKRVEKKKEEAEEKLIGQVVDLPEPEVEKPPPEKPKYLSQHNTKTEKEQKAKRRGDETRKRDGKTSLKHSKIQSPQSMETEVTKVPTDNEKPLIPMRNDLLESKKGELFQKKFDRERVSQLLLPSNGMETVSEKVQTITGTYASDDVLLEITEEGDVTMLNSKKFKYWDFFNRVKEQVRREWEPGKVYREKDPYGKIYGFKDRLTILRVTLDANGNLTRVETIKESGLNFLDAEAVKAFKEAQPFHNPPKGLLDQHGLITFNFGFLLEISTSKFKFFY